MKSLFLYASLLVLASLSPLACTVQGGKSISKFYEQQTEFDRSSDIKYTRHNASKQQGEVANRRDLEKRDDKERDTERRKETEREAELLKKFLATKPGEETNLNKQLSALRANIRG